MLVEMPGDVEGDQKGLPRPRMLARPFGQVFQFEQRLDGLS